LAAALRGNSTIRIISKRNCGDGRGSKGRNNIIGTTRSIYIGTGISRNLVGGRTAVSTSEGRIGAGGVRSGSAGNRSGSGKANTGNGLGRIAGDRVQSEVAHVPIVRILPITGGTSNMAAKAINRTVNNNGGDLGEGGRGRKKHYDYGN
jgi:hypothetical protein